MTACTRGCTRPRRHLADDPDRDTCPGCLPREATNGKLCDPCHRRLRTWLTDAPVVIAWLDVHMTRGTARPVKNDAQMRSSNTAAPAPIDLDVYDLTQEWSAFLAGWTKNLVDDHNLTGPDHYDVRSCGRYLLAWADRIEKAEWVADFYDELDDITRRSHQRVPWRPEFRRLPGIPCPECHRVALALFGGSEDYTCTHCGLIITPARYLLWTKIAAEEWGKTDARTRPSSQAG